MIDHNAQVLLLNEFKPNDKKEKDEQGNFTGEGYYNTFKAETSLRMLASGSSNVYIISLFACCRQNFYENMTIAHSEFKAKEIQELLA